MPVPDTQQDDILVLARSLGSNVGTAYTVAKAGVGFLKDKFGYNEPDYRDEDCAIINEARELYLKLFKDKPLPTELRYHHEPFDGILNAKADPPPDGEKWSAPQKLNPTYPIDGFYFTKGGVGTLCKTAVLKLAAYLDAINKESTTRYNKVVHHYGHKSDAVRYVILLIMNGFSAISQMNLKSAAALKSVKQYSEFLYKLILSDNIVPALKRITEVEVGGIPQKPLTAFSIAFQHLDEIKDLIKHNQSKTSIFEKMEEFHNLLDGYIEGGFVFSCYILAGYKVAELDTILGQVTTNQKVALKSLREELSSKAD